jgi:hypothetical protein
MNEMIPSRSGPKLSGSSGLSFIGPRGESVFPALGNTSEPRRADTLGRTVSLAGIQPVVTRVRDAMRRLKDRCF